MSFTKLKAQLSVSNAPPYNTIDYLIKNVFIGTGVEVSNIKFNGQTTLPFGYENSIGYFQDTQGYIGLKEGILISTGDIKKITSQNTANIGISISSVYSDPDIVKIANTTLINDISVIEFDFVPTNSLVEFRYIFASEEYNDFVCSSFNDVFGFFISGPGISGPYTNNAKNIALIPGTNQPVSINTVNNGNPGINCMPTNPEYYIDNTLFNVPNKMEYNGYTKVLTARADVIPCQTYHLKIAIADIADFRRDSGVFLQAKSFTSSLLSAKVIYTNVNNANYIDKNIIEACDNNMLLRFERNNATTTETFNLQVSGTAVMGIDFSNLPSQIQFPTGTTMIDISIQAFEDNLVENTEHLTIKLTGANSCSPQPVNYEFNFYIIDKSNSNIQLNLLAADTVCINSNATFTAHATGANLAYIYSWERILPQPSTIINNTSADKSILTVNNILETSTYKVTVKDLCNSKTTSAQKKITVLQPFTYQLTLDMIKDTTIYCPNTTINVFANASNGLAPYTYKWYDANGVLIANTNQFNYTPKDFKQLYLSVTDACFTEVYNDVDIITDFPKEPLKSNITNKSVIYCTNQPSVTLIADAKGGASKKPYTYAWSHALGNTKEVNVSPSTNTTYSVVITDFCGQSISDNIIVNMANTSPIQVDLTADKTLLNCPNESVKLTATVSGGQPPYELIWDNGLFANVYENTAKPKDTTMYHLLVKDFCQLQTAQDSVQIFVPEYKTMQITTTPDTLICINSSAILKAQVSGGRLPLSFSWDNGASNNNQLMVTPKANSKYKVTVTDACNYVAEKQVKVNISQVYANQPTIIFQNAYTVNFKNNASKEAIDYLWDLGDGTFSKDKHPLHVYKDTIEYPIKLIVKNDIGCADSVAFNIRIYPEDKLFLPNAFTPNGDGINDTYYAKGIGIKNYQLMIFNRKGQLVFKTNQLHDAWNGMYNGTIIQDVYAYKVIYENYIGTTKEITGKIELIP